MRGRLFILSLGLATPVVAQQPPQRVNNGGLPAFSPDGKQIAFIASVDGTNDVYVMNADGSGRTRLTRTPDFESAPRWSADGKSVVFAVGRDTSRVYAIDPSGSNQHSIATIAGSGVTYSPDGRRMTYGTGTMPEMTLAVAKSDGSDAKIVDGASPAFNMAWSPDGKRIAYTTFTPTHETIVRVMNADGTGSRDLVSSAMLDGSPQWPTWSPDGKRIAIQVGKYSREKPTDNTAHIWVVDVTSGEKKKLAAHSRPYLDETPSWSKDGRIAFQSDRTGRMEVWVMNADGTGAVQLTR